MTVIAVVVCADPIQLFGSRREDPLLLFKLLMRTLRAREASIFLTSDFLFQIRFKISAFVRYLYIIIYNIDVLFRFLNEKTHLDNHFHNHSA